MGKRILVIDDEKVMLRLVQAILTRAGYEVITAENIDDALAYLKDHTFDLITCDLMLRGTGGLEFLEILKSVAILPAPPVIVITAAGFQQELDRARQLGAAQILSKPFTPQQLVEVVAEVVK